MRHVELLAAWSAAIAVAAGSAPAGITAYWQENPITPAAIADTPALAKMWSWSLIAQTDGDWASAGLRATLPAGRSYFNHSFGGNTHPNPDIVAAFPGAAFDTYVSGPRDTGDVNDPNNNPPGLLDGHPAGSPSSFSGTTFSASWFNLTVDLPGTYEIARLTFPRDAFPTIYSEGSPATLPNTSNTSQVNPASFTFLGLIPEPASIGLLAVLLMSRRRRD